MASFQDLIHEIHRRSLWQVLGVYAVASWIIWQVIGSLYEWIGLPGWVPGATLVLLLLGLPIVLATAFVQEGGPGSDDGSATGVSLAGLETTADSVARRSSSAAEEALAGESEGGAVGVPAAAGGQKRSTTNAGPDGAFLTWSKAITGGLLAFAVLGLASAGFTAMRALGIGPAATLISSGELGEGTRVLVADFDSPPGDSLTAFALAEAMRIDLGQSDALVVADPAELGPALRRMERAPSARLTESVARELAAREGIPAVLVGDVTPVGSGYQITARMVRSDTNRVLLRVRETAENADDVLPAMDRLTERLLERTGESLRTIRSSGRLPEVTTSSLEALRLYTQARRAAELENDDRGAEELLEEALGIDSTFAMAWRKLGTVRGNYGNQAGEVEALSRAYELRDRLPPRSRYFTEATYYAQVDYDPRAAIAVFERILEMDPDDWGPHHNIGALYAGLGEYERAEAATERAAALDSTALSLGNLVLYRLSIGDTVGAREALEARRRLYPDNSSNPALTRDLQYARGDVDGMRRNIERVLRQDERIGPRESALRDRALLEAREGRIREAVRTLEEREAEREQAGWFTGAHHGIAGGFHIFATGDTARARDEFERFERIVIEELPELDRPYLIVAGNRAILGDVQQARALIARWEETVPAGVRKQSEGTRRWALGVIAMAEGRTDAAIEHLEAATERNGLAYLWHYFVALGNDRAGRTDSAIAAYHRYLETPHWNRLWPDGTFLGHTYERLSVLHEERGDTAQAAKYYSRLIDLWEDADSDLQPRVDAARRALARLAAEG